MLRSDYQPASLLSVTPSIQPLKVFPKPPVGFNPLTASPSQLAAYGFPARPSSGASLQAWGQAMEHATQEVPPNPVLGTENWGLDGTHNGSWGGYSDLSSNNGGVSYNEVQANWNVSAIPGNSSYPNTDWQSAPKVGMWTGFGGYNSSYGPVQAGTADIATSTPQYRFWTEDAPASPVYEGPVVNADDEVFVDVTWAGNNSADYFLENETTGKYSSFQNSAPYPNFDAADYQTEEQGAYLPDFVSTQFNGCFQFWNSGTSSGYFENYGYDKFNLYDSATGHELDYPGGIQSSANGFGVYWTSGT